MPGLSLEIDTGTEAEFEAKLADLTYFDGYTKEVLYTDGRLKLGWSGYDRYPIRTFETETHFLALEGELYATADIETELRSVLEALEEGDTDRLEEWLLNRDGEFLLVAVEKSSGTVRILNDVLGRLPVYSYADGKTVLVSRELGLLVDHADIGIDEMAVAQMLLFGYPLGQRTLYDPIEQLAPGSVQTIADGEVTTTRLHQLRINSSEHGTDDVSANARTLAELLSTACRRRMDPNGQNIVSLSGGLDSRAIAACFSAQELPFVGRTFRYTDGSNDDEVAVAREVMAVLGGDWEAVEVAGPTTGQMNELLGIKRGMNPLSMGFIIDFFEQLNQEFGHDAVYFVGDGGDKLFPRLVPRSYPDEGAVVDAILTNESRFDLETVERLTGQSGQDLRAAVRQQLAAYPPADPSGKYAQFLFWERGGNWLLHGEDRNRYYFWNTSPYYSLPVVSYAMKIPDRQKKHNRLFRELFDVLSPPLLDIEYANVGAPINSYEYKLKQMGYNRLQRHPRLHDLVVSVLKGELNGAYDRSLAEILGALTSNHSAHETVLEMDAIEEIRSDRTGHDETAVYHLVTIVAAIEQLYGDRVVLDVPTGPMVA